MARVLVNVDEDHIFLSPAEQSHKHEKVVVGVLVQEGGEHCGPSPAEQCYYIVDDKEYWSGYSGEDILEVLGMRLGQGVDDTEVRK